jgi:alpha-glucosidase
MSFLATAGRLQSTSRGAIASLSHGFRLQIDVLEDWLVRIAVIPAEGFEVDRTWMIAPQGEVEWSGRDRLDDACFSAPRPEVDATAGSIIGRRLKVELTEGTLGLTVSRRETDGWKPCLRDREAGAYIWFGKRSLLRHYHARSFEDRHYGLADKTGPLDRTGRRFRCLQTDGLGYDAELSDPLYKHAPFLIVENDRAGAIGILYDTLCETTFDLGAEHSNYHPHYRHVEVQEKGLVYYIIDGPEQSEVVKRLAALTGKPHLPPRWSFGFAFTTMHHADAPNAQQVIANFAETCRTEQIPISAIHSGSGYTTKEDGRRYVFTWNNKKFPDRAGFFGRLRELGFTTVANVKPVLLTEHPAYRQSEEEGLFVRRADGRPAVEMFWGGHGSSLDFTNPQTIAWWKDGIRKQVLGEGFTGAWNDNNECELWDETAMLEGFGKPSPAMDMRPVHALLMTRATFEATREHKPDLRPYTLSRAGPIGIARYGETWTGDNATSWHTLKWNLRNGLSMSLSGMPLVGHDIGGFAGPKPDAELLVRWVQMMALHPRAVMNSWKPQFADPVNVPWMHAEATPLVREALRLRYRFLPYLYSLAWHSHMEGSPVIAPLFHYFDDPECRQEWDAFLLGRDVLVAPVVGEGERKVSVYLPEVAGGWHDEWTGEILEGGRRVTVEAPLGRLPVFVRTGAILPLASHWPDIRPHDADQIEITLYAGDAAGSTSARIFCDDGESWRYADQDASLLTCEASWDEGEVRLAVKEGWSGRGRPASSLVCRNAKARRLDFA